jgi:hypothetical protein
MNSTLEDMIPMKNEKVEMIKTSSEISKEIAKDIPTKNLIEIPKEIPSKKSEEIPKEKPENACELTSKDISKTIPAEVPELKQTKMIINKENNEKISEKNCETDINTCLDTQEDKTSNEESINVISLNKKEETEEESNKNEMHDKNVKISDKSSDINELSFPIINPKKALDAINPDYNSLSLLNKALSQSQLNFYYMNLKIPDNLEPKNKFSSQISPSDSNIMFNSGPNTIPNFFLESNPQSYNFFGRKYHRNSNLSHFIPVTFSCSSDTSRVGKSRIKYVQKEKEFFEKIIKIGDVTNITEFWDIFQHMKKPSQCPVGTDYHLFKRGIIPMWEDNMNKDGGKLSVLLTWKYANLIWEEVTFNFSKGLLPYYENINGIVISMRARFIVLSFWLKIKTTHLVEKIRYALSSMLQTPSTNCIDFIAFN